MGRVFTWDEVKNKRIPHIKSFFEIKERIRELFDSPAITGAVVFGSVARDDITVRSDFDCFVIYEPEHKARAQQILEKVYDFASIRNVPLELIVVDREIAATPAHDVHLSLLGHLRWAAEHGGVVKANPLHCVAFKHLNPVEEVRSYFRYKIRSFERGMFRIPLLHSKEMATLLKIALDSPIQIARTLVPWNDNFLADRSREKMFKAYREMVPADLLVDAVPMRAVDSVYDAMLAGAAPSMDEYSSLLHSAMMTLPWAFRFLKNNAREFEKRTK